MIGTGSPERNDDALAAEYAVGVLPHTEREAFARRLENEPRLREKLRIWEEHLFELSTEFAPETPPANALQRIESKLFGNPSKRANLSGSLAFFRALSVGALGLSAILASLLFWPAGMNLQAPQTYVAELSAQDSDVRMLAVYNPDEGNLRFSMTAGAPEPGRAFELWFIEGDNAPISLGVIPASAKSELPVDENLKNKLMTSVLAVSDEPTGGSPTGAPTGRVLATGKLTSL